MKNRQIDNTTRLTLSHTDTDKQSEMVYLEVINKNENSARECKEILEWQQQYVPEGESIIEFGDELTVERILNVLEDRRNEKDIIAQLCNIIPTISNFHTLKNFLEAIWKTDVGTVYQGKCFFNAKNAPDRPVKNPDFYSKIICIP